MILIVSVSGVIRGAHFWSLFCSSKCSSRNRSVKTNHQNIRRQLRDTADVLVLEFHLLARLILSFKIKLIFKECSCVFILVTPSSGFLTLFQQSYGAADFSTCLWGHRAKRRSWRGWAEAPRWPLTHANQLCGIPSSSDTSGLSREPIHGFTSSCLSGTIHLSLLLCDWKTYLRAWSSAFSVFKSHLFIVFLWYFVPFSFLTSQQLPLRSRGLVFGAPLNIWLKCHRGPF